MISSFTDKVKSFIFSSNTTENGLNVSRKRKNPFPDSDETDGGPDIQVLSVKKPKLQNTGSVFQGFLHSTVVQNMSDWVQKKTPSFFWKSDKEKTSSHGNGYGPNGSSGNNGSSHNRFKRVDCSKGASGNWPKHSNNYFDETLTRPSIHASGIQSTQTGPPVHANGKQSRAAELGMGSSRSKTGSKRVQEKFDRMFKMRNKHKFTATESVRLDDKVRYQQLLQQFTTLPLSETTQSVDNISKPVCVPQLPRFYFNSNASILGSATSQDLKPMVKFKAPDQPRIKFQPNYKSTPQSASVRSVADDSLVHITDISEIRPVPQERTTILNSKPIDLTQEPDEEPQLVKTEYKQVKTRTEQNGEARFRTKSPTNDYRESKYLSENWIKDLTATYNSKARERERKIAEEEIKTKLYDERRRNEEIDLEQKIRQQMQIYKKEPAIAEEFPDEEIEEEEEEELKEEQLPELTKEMNNKIDQCLHRSYSGEVLVDKFRLQITKNDIATLDGLNWLNDEIINFYMNMLMERGESDGKAKVYAFNTFFYPKVMSGGQAAVKRWTRRVDVLAVDYILIPVHLGMHWCLAVINFKKKDIQYYDSMSGNNTQCLNALKKYLCDESQDKRKKEFDLSGWKTTTIKDIPQQMNGSDCGMFACKYAEYITREASITFTQANMPYFRRRMVYEIVTAKLLQ